MSQQRVHDPDASLPSPGSARAIVPPLPRYYQGTATSCRPSRRASFPSVGGTTGTRSFRSRRRGVWPASGLGLVARYPRPGWLPWRRQDLPSSWGVPIPVCTWSQTPDGRCAPDRFRGNRVVPANGTTRTPTTTRFRGSIAWLSGSPPMYHDVGRPSPRQAGFQVLVRLSWTGLIPAGLLQKVFNSLHVRRPPFPSFLAQSICEIPGP
jgi:hypothetical protein